MNGYECFRYDWFNYDNHGRRGCAAGSLFALAKIAFRGPCDAPSLLLFPFLPFPFPLFSFLLFSSLLFLSSFCYLFLSFSSFLFLCSYLLFIVISDHNTGRSLSFNYKYSLFLYRLQYVYCCLSYLYYFILFII